MAKPSTIHPQSILVTVRRASFLLAFVIFVAGVLCGQENVIPDAILAQGKAIILFTRMAACDENFVPGTSQLMVSSDGGRSWKKRGPALPGYEFTSFFEKDGKLWIAGDHTMEGPATDPFIFIPTKLPLHWEMRTIYEGNGGLERIAWGGKGELIAWVPHLKLDQGWEGPTYIHQSLDDGRTWKTLGRAKKLKVEKGLGFTDLGTLKNPLWRITHSRDETDFKVQHRETVNDPWKTVSRFLHHRCP